MIIEFLHEISWFCVRITVRKWTIWKHLLMRNIDSVADFSIYIKTYHIPLLLRLLQIIFHTVNSFLPLSFTCTKTGITHIRNTWIFSGLSQYSYFARNRWSPNNIFTFYVTLKLLTIFTYLHTIQFNLSIIASCSCHKVDHIQTSNIRLCKPERKPYICNCSAYCGDH